MSTYTRIVRNNYHLWCERITSEKLKTASGKWSINIVTWSSLPPKQRHKIIPLTVSSRKSLLANVLPTHCRIYSVTCRPARQHCRFLISSNDTSNLVESHNTPHFASDWNHPLLYRKLSRHSGTPVSFLHIKILAARFMNITTYPYHLTERQLKLCHVRDSSTVTGAGSDSPNTWRTRSRPLFAICGLRRNPIL